MDRAKLLIVEDEEGIRQQLKWVFAAAYQVFLARDWESARQVLAQERPPVVLLDMGLPPFPHSPDEGLRLLSEVMRTDSLARVVVLTGQDRREDALRAMELGAYDYCSKPADVEELRVIIKRAHHVYQLRREGQERCNGPDRGQGTGIIGRSPAIREALARVQKVAASNTSVLLTGESGTGKELLAQAIHGQSPRAQGPFISLNCAAIPEGLMESELFGHERGSFTGAYMQQKGKIEYAHKGTLFLDEIGEMTPPLQAKLLRFLQDHLIERVGGRKRFEVDVRVIAATHRDLQVAIEEGGFRDDLYYRLAVVTVAIPPLREREGDPVLLARHFLERFSREMGRPWKGLSPEALRAIETYPWPGNVRQLENAVRQALLLAEGELIGPDDLGLSQEGVPPARRLLRDARQEIERDLIVRTLEGNGWNVSRTARQMGISRSSLHDLFRKYGIRRQRERDGYVSAKREVASGARPA